MLNRPMNFTLFTCIALLASLLSSCGGSTNIKPSNVSHTNSVTRADSKPQLSTSIPKELITKAQQQISPERENTLLLAAEIYLEQGELDNASNLLNSMSPGKLSDQTFVNYSCTMAQINLNNGEVDNAKRILTNSRLERQLNAIDPTQEAKLREIRAQTFVRTGLLEEAVSERISLSALLTNNKANSANQEILWQTLMNIPLADLQANAAKGMGGITQGWYSLATISKNNTLTIEVQQAQLNQWLTQWQNHPANGNLPKDLNILQTLISQQPRKIALLLPLQGTLIKAGEAVRDGFFAAYYQSFNNNQPAPSVREYDTSKGATAAYHQAVADGADLIIGPLDKEDVNQLSLINPLPVPLLSLNYLSINETLPNAQPAPIVPGFYQFGLAVEDEARQAARQGIQDGLSHALIVTSTQEWSERSAQAFSNEWQKLGGTIVGKSMFTTQDVFSESIRDMLLINESQLRMRLLQQQLSTKFEFVPRLRNDINMIFMAVAPSQGRQIKPTFIFHFASHIPIYATSNIYSGDIDAINNEDLNGVKFNTLPWIFDNNNPEKIAITQTNKSSAVYSRLHALGADAFHLYPRLSQLKQAPDMQLYGATGSLHLLSDGRIEREQIWARFTNGLAEPILTVTDVDQPVQGE